MFDPRLRNSERELLTKGKMAHIHARAHNEIKPMYCAPNIRKYVRILCIVVLLCSNSQNNSTWNWNWAYGVFQRSAR